jgi:hypothetical protein
MFHSRGSLAPYLSLRSRMIVVAGVVVLFVVALAQGEDVDGAGERDVDRLVHAPAVEPVDEAAGATLVVGRGDERGVDAQAGRRGRVGPRGDVVGQRDVGQRAVIEVELDRDLGRLRAHEALGLGARGDSEQ